MKTQTIPFCVLYFEPDAARGERVNIGVAAFAPNGVMIRLARNLSKVSAIAPGFDLARLRDFPDSASRMLAKLPGTEDRHRLLAGGCGPIRADALGELFLGERDNLENELAALVSTSAETALSGSRPRIAVPRGKLFSDLKRFFRSQQVLADSAEQVQNHVVANFPINPDARMFAEFAVKNGHYYITETVDVRAINRGKLNETGAKGLLLDQSRVVLGDSTSRFAIVAADSLDDARPIFATLKPYCTVLNYHDAADMDGYLAIIGKATKRQLQLARN